MKYFSETTGKSYESEEATYYRNLIQAAWLLGKPDATLLDIFVDNGGKMVLVFPKELHKKYVAEWAERSRQNRDNEDI